MGLRGPQPKPTAMRVLEGNPSGRPINAFEPTPPQQSILKPPRELSAFGIEVWNRVVPMLVLIGTATDADIGTLIRYCDYAEQYVNARNTIRNSGTTYPIKDDKGQIKYVAQLPQVSIMRLASEHMLKIESHFGLTPSTRSRLIATPQSGDGDDDPFNYD